MALECRRLTLQDVEALREIAALHRRSLSESMVSVFGPAVLARYYEFLVTSEQEAVFVCSVDGHVAGAAVISEEPEALIGKFLRRATPAVVWHIAIGTLTSISTAKRVARSVRQPKPLPAVDGMPEVVQLFVDPSIQGSGLGRALLADVERHLAGSGHGSYFVKTLAADDNQALGFYDRLGFEPAGEQTLQGFRFRFLIKRLA
jgi:ribosomal protein S18 acetylase RimI-like enzyme